MSMRDRLATFDGLQSIVMGVDSGRSPAVLDRAHLSWGVNITTRGGFITCRPGWLERVLSFPNEEGGTDTALRDAFEDGMFQGASGYVSDSGIGQLVVSISGHIYAIDVASYVVTELTNSTTGTNAPNLAHTWMTQAEQWLVIQNASDDALVYDGTQLVRSIGTAKGGQGIPIGGPMAYNNGRLWVALAPSGLGNDFFSFTGGDLAYSNGQRSAVLNFTDRNYLTSGDFAVPSSAGPIRAMQSIAIQDSSTGQGPLQVFTTRGSFSVNAPFNVEEWAALTSPIQTVSMLAAGAVSAASAVNVNGDIWFRSPDGIRSFMVARRDQGTWVNTPLSREMTRSLDYDSKSLLGFASAGLFDNRLLMTAAPERVVDSDGVSHGTIHRAIAALDFAPVSRMFDRSQPTWEGIWTGLRILAIVPLETEVRRLFIFALDDANDIILYELTAADRFDNGTSRISWFFETPAYGFEDGGWNLKRLAYADQWSDRIAGEVEFTARYRPDAYPFWLDWHVWEVCASMASCFTEECEVPLNKHEQYRSRQRLPMPSDECDEVHGTPYREAYRFQARVDVVGHARIRQLRLVAREIPEPAEGSCP